MKTRVTQTYCDRCGQQFTKGVSVTVTVDTMVENVGNTKENKELDICQKCLTDIMTKVATEKSDWLKG